ncbi:hypothetical protein ABIF65_004680 [Bradyrhizobium japonicum]|jgi:hypothetical protein|nr:hypothetical protein [Bradyrhizobium japonicum]MCP1781360.1 hypothetical protein [Bradyrhizobium japonicum]MCP1860714.1 hypothetical protein [Bradyrhizobium japonicum]MCP1891477.1 hypothetical protein [Bradyrhizobium japonicum]MCP1955649.1 hypothetical protein [Bradyrhizobium japonicum]
MQNPGEDECAQPVPRFYVTLRDTSEGRATACNGRDLLIIRISGGKDVWARRAAMVREVGELSAHLVV